MLKQLKKVPIFLQIIIISTFLVISIVFTVATNSRSKFATITGIHGFVILIEIVLVYWQKMDLIDAKVQGYSAFYRRIDNQLEIEQYIFTVSSVLVMILLIITQTPFDSEQDSAKNDVIQFF